MIIDRTQIPLWINNTRRQIMLINNAIGNDLTGENYYSLGFRGKHHRSVLLKDGIIVARGIIAINNYLASIIKYYHIKYGGNEHGSK